MTSAPPGRTAAMSAFTALPSSLCVGVKAICARQVAKTTRPQLFVHAAGKEALLPPRALDMA